MNLGISKLYNSIPPISGILKKAVGTVAAYSLFTPAEAKTLGEQTLSSEQKLIKLESYINNIQSNLQQNVKSIVGVSIFVIYAAPTLFGIMGRTINPLTGNSMCTSSTIILSGIFTNLFQSSMIVRALQLATANSNNLNLENDTLYSIPIPICMTMIAALGGVFAYRGAYGYECNLGRNLFARLISVDPVHLYPNAEAVAGVNNRPEIRNNRNELSLRQRSTLSQDATPSVA